MVSTEEEKLHQEIAKEAISDTSPKKELPHHIKRAIAIVSVAFILILFSIYLLPPTAWDYTQAYFSTFEAKEGKIELDGMSSIVFEFETFDRLLKIYHSNQKEEIKLCLLGSNMGGNYRVTDIFGPRIYSQSFSHVSSEPCPTGTIIDLHTHPYRSCFFSSLDLSNLPSIKSRNEDAFMGIMCAPNRFNFYGYT